ncbi:MAG: hypothetical protein ACHQT6_11575 [Candidatus Acidiferrales bacterium]
MAAQSFALGGFVEGSKLSRVQREAEKLGQKLQQTAAVAVVHFIPNASPLASLIPQFEPAEVTIVSSDLRIRPSLNSLSSGVVSDIDRLAAGAEDETAPTQFAYEKARSIVQAAYGKLEIHVLNVPGIVPAPLVTTDDAGGIRLAWQAGAKQMRANFGAVCEPQRRSYIYYEFGQEHAVEQLDVEHLVGRLSWLMAR